MDQSFTSFFFFLCVFFQKTKKCVLSFSFPFYSSPGGSVGFVESVLDLLDTIPSRHEHTGNDQGIRLFLGGIKLFAGLSFQPHVPRFTRLIAPMKGLARSQYFTV